MAIDPPSPENLNDWAKDFDQIAVDIAASFPDQATRLRIYGQGSRNWASIGPFIVAPGPKITKVTLGQDANGQRIDFETDSAVETYGRENAPPWMSDPVDPLRRTFDLTYLAPSADIPVVVNWVDGEPTRVVIRTNPKVEVPPVDPPPSGTGKLQQVPSDNARSQHFAQMIGVAIDSGYDAKQLPSNFADLAELGAGIARLGGPFSNVAGIAQTFGGLTRPQWFKKMHDELGIKINLISDSRDCSIATTVAIAKQWHEAEGWVDSIELDNELDLARYGPVYDGYTLAGVGTDDAGQRKAIQSVMRPRADAFMQALNAAGRPKDLYVSSGSMAQTLKTILWDWFGIATNLGLDGLTFHYYGGAKAIRTQHMAIVLATLNKICGPSAGMLCTETGFSTALGKVGGHPPVTEEIQAILTPQIYMEHAMSGRCVGVTNYALKAKSYDNDAAGNPLNWEGGFGLVAANGRKKPAFHSLRRLTAWNKDAAPNAMTHPIPNRGVTVAGAGIRSFVTHHSTGKTLIHLSLDGNITAPADAYNPGLILNERRTANLSWLGKRDYGVRHCMDDGIKSSGKGASSLGVVVDAAVTVVELAP